MDLHSDAFPPGGWIPRDHSGDGADRSPPLRWSDAPDEVGAFALIMDDPDAPPGLWIHWVLFNLPPHLRELPPGQLPLERLESGAQHGACWGVESFERLGYAGPLPPPGPAHRYRFRLTALDAPLPLPPGATAAAVRAAMAGHILAEAELVGLYQRHAP
ncbi:MAG: YbhB/YbcL family Raf kinase inhibitor-like protein [Cyanobacteriota bacterium]